MTVSQLLDKLSTQGVLDRDWHVRKNYDVELGTDSDDCKHIDVNDQFEFVRLY